ncbi:ERAD-associated protein [Coemansia sp. Benny D115]|nr:ERAD-associated protein [Coemansia sp. Benny D115]
MRLARRSTAVTPQKTLLLLMLLAVLTLLCTGAAAKSKLHRVSDAGAHLEVEQSSKELDDAVFSKAHATLLKYEAELQKQQEHAYEESGLEPMLVLMERQRALADLVPAYLRGAASAVQRMVHSAGQLVGLASSHSRLMAQPKPPMEVTRALRQVEELARAGHVNSRLLQAKAWAFGRFGTKANLTRAAGEYEQLAEQGNAQAQHMLGFLYATGLGVRGRQMGRALVLTTLAADQGLVAARMAAGYARLSGIGTPMECNDALQQYHAVAENAMRLQAAGPPLGRQLPEPNARLVESAGGVYGVAAGPRSPLRAAGRAEFAELLAAHRQRAREGDVAAGVAVAEVLYHGHQHQRRDHPAALRILRAMTSYAFHRGEVRAVVAQDATERAAAAQAAGMLGIMLLRGEGGEARDLAQALEWLNAGAALGHGAAMAALAHMHEKGLGVARDAVRAADLARKAAELGHAGGLVMHARLIADSQPEMVADILRRAATAGHVVAHFRLGEYYAARVNGGADGAAQCRLAVALFRHVAETADWGHSPMPAATAALRRGDAHAALLHLMLAAEMGYSGAQQAAAALLERHPRPLLYSTRAQAQAQALVYWTRAAAQGVADARSRQADCFLEGRGTRPNTERAVAAYRLAGSANERSGLALWRLGYLYEHGMGVARDFHMAKRYYDEALAMHEPGKLAVYLSLVRLCVRYLGAWARGEDVGEAPLFFTPQEPPAEQDVEADDAGAGAGAASDTDADDGWLSEGVFFAVLLVAAAWMIVLPLRR